jgi:hypothetical protein
MAKSIGRNLVARLFRPRHDYLPGTTIFREIDVDTLASEMKLEEAGERDGQAEIPASKSVRTSGVENEILKRFRTYWDDAAKGARAAYESYASRAAALTTATDIDTLVGEPHSIVSALRESARSAQDTLRAGYDSYLEASAALALFKKSEGLDRPPKQPKTAGVRVLVLMVAVLIELAINISTFAAGDEFGLAGAALKVLAVPLLNIGGVFLLVFLIGRHIVRRKISAKLVGLLGLILATTWAFYLNLAVAHWRDSLGLAFSSDAGKMALDRVLHSTFELNDINSWVLFFAGCAAAIMGAIDAFIWHDPHPGYTSHFMAKSDAAADYGLDRDDALARLDEIAQDSIERLTDALRRAETNAARRPELAQRADALSEDLKTYRSTLTAAAEDLITRYREANQRARKTDPPQRFETPITLSLSTVTLPALAAAARPGEVTGLLSSAMREISDGRSMAAESLPTLHERQADAPAP